jgi:hypothetical protein
MVRAPRNYRAEYARRVQRETDRATREGRPVSRTRARGHNGIEDRARDRAQRQYIKNAAAMSTQVYPSWADVKAAAKNYSWERVEEVLRQQAVSLKAYRAGNVTPGKAYYDANSATALPIEFLWYHPA